jgi:putative transposase
MTLAGLVRYHVLFLMELKTRRVHVAEISQDPCDEWMAQIARNLTDAYDGFLRNAKILILDRDPLFTAQFRRMLKDRGVRVVRLPRESPNLNAYVERWVLSIRREVLDRIIPLGERHLRRAIGQFVAHYHAERNHQGLDGKLIEPEPGVGVNEGRVLCRLRLGGLLKYYYREAA